MRIAPLSLFAFAACLVVGCGIEQLTQGGGSSSSTSATTAGDGGTDAAGDSGVVGAGCGVESGLEHAALRGDEPVPDGGRGHDRAPALRLPDQGRLVGAGVRLWRLDLLDGRVHDVRSGRGAPHVPDRAAGVHAARRGSLQHGRPGAVDEQQLLERLDVRQDVHGGMWRRQRVRLDLRLLNG